MVHDSFDFVPDGQMAFDFANGNNGSTANDNSKYTNTKYTPEKIENAKATIADFIVWCERRPSCINRINNKFLEDMASPTANVSGVWLREETRKNLKPEKLEGKKYGVDNNYEPVLARSLAKTYPQYSTRIRRRRSIYDLPELANLIPTLDKFVGITVG